MILVVQRGHVGRHTGSTGAPGEQELATRIAARIAELAPAGLQVRIIDADEPTHRYGGDAFVALHGDGSSNPNVGGASVGYRGPAGRELADRWKLLYAHHGWPFGFRADNYTANLARYYGTGRAITAGNPRAVILEHGFLTNPKERAWLESERGTEAAARAVLEAVTGRRGRTAPPVDARPAPDQQKGATMTEEQARQLDELHRVLCRDRRVADDLALLRRGVRAIAAKLGVATRYDADERVDA